MPYSQVERSVTLDLDNQGLVLGRPPDLITPANYSDLFNMTSNKSGYLQTRRGSTLVGSALGSPVHSLARLISAGKNYQGASVSLFRDFVSIATGFSGSPLVMEDGKIDISALPHLIVFDSLKRVKDDGTTLTNFGSITPAVASAVAAAIQTKTIDLFEYAIDADIQAAYTGASIAIATDTVDPKQGTYSGKFTVVASTVGTATRTVALNLEQFSVSGDSDDDDFIHFWLKVDEPSRLVEIRLQFDVDPTTNDFTKNYYWKSILPNDITPAVSGTITAKTIRDDILTRAALREVDTLGTTDSRIDDLDYEELVAGKSQWTEFFITKKDFQRVGSHANDWGNVAAFRLSIETNAGGTVVVNIDDGKMQGGTTYRLDGSFDWRYRYRNHNTGSKSPLSPEMTAVAVAKSKATVTVTNPTDTQFTYIDLVRRGGTQPTGWKFVSSTLVTAWSGTVAITDGLPEESLGALQDTDQIELSNTAATTDINPTALAIHAERAWVDDPANTDRLWYSRRFKIEEFTAEGWIQVSKGGDRVRRHIELDDNLFAFTDKTVYRIVGTDEISFQALGTGVENGLFSKWAICVGAGAIFYRASDGIFALSGSGQAEKLSLGIDPIFHGLDTGTLGRLKAIDDTAKNDERLEFFDGKLHFAYKSTDGNRYELILDFAANRWEQTDRKVTSYLKLKDLGYLYSGHDDGMVYRRYVGNTDNGTAISYSFRGKYLDFDMPQQEKSFVELVPDVDANGSTITFTADFDNGTGTQDTLSYTGTGRQTTFFPMDSDPTKKAKNIAFGASGSNGGLEVRFYKVSFNFWSEPRGSSLLILETDFGYPRWKFLRRAWICGRGTDITMKVYIDERLRYTSPAFSLTSSGQIRKRLILPPKLKGQLCRLVFSGTDFKIFLDQSDIEWRPLATERGYNRWSLGSAA